MNANPLPHRPHVRPYSALIARLSMVGCWHYDARLYRANGGLYIEVATSAGGRRELSISLYKVRDGGLYDATGVKLDNTVSRGLNDLIRAERDIVVLATYSHIIPWSRVIPAGYRSRSVALHYWPAPDIAAVDNTVTNYYMTGRGRRNDVLKQHENNLKLTLDKVNDSL